MIRKLLILLSIMAFVGCQSGGRGTTQAGNPEGSTSPKTGITIGSLTADGKSTITIPLSLFGSSQQALSGASYGVVVNNVIRLSGQDPAKEFLADQQVVQFVLDNLKPGDVIVVVIQQTNQEPQAYEAPVSATQTSSATESDACEKLPVYINYDDSANFNDNGELALRTKVKKVAAAEGATSSGCDTVVSSPIVTAPPKEDFSEDPSPSSPGEEVTPLDLVNCGIEQSFPVNYPGDPGTVSLQGKNLTHDCSDPEGDPVPSIVESFLGLNYDVSIPFGGIGEVRMTQTKPQQDINAQGICKWDQLFTVHMAINKDTGQVTGTICREETNYTGACDAPFYTECRVREEITGSVQ